MASPLPDQERGIMQVEGLEVKIYHERGPMPAPAKQKMSMARTQGALVEGYTGRTIAVVWDGDKRHVGISQCAMGDINDPPRVHNVTVNFDGRKQNFQFTSGTPVDQFNRKLGRKIATNRAMFAKQLVDNRAKGQILRKGHNDTYFTFETVETAVAAATAEGLPVELFTRVERKLPNEAVQNSS